jgi:acetyltransferase-like isoleucine patch superfamily enzyme
MYYTMDELNALGLKSFGNNVFIDKTVLFHNPNEIEIGHNSRIDAYVVISGKVILGKNVHIATGVIMNGGKLGILISDFCGIAYGGCLFTTSDDYSGSYLTNPTIPKKYKNIKEKQIIIEKHVIIGARSVVFPGVKLSEGTSVGSLSLVARSTIPWKIYFGIPAVIISDRKKDLLALEAIYSEENSNNK